ncbi:MAG: uroporphyrinogen-III synthase [bacterium]
MNASRGPLAGWRVLVPRDPSQAEAFCHKLDQLGAVPVPCPLIAFVPPADWGPVDRALEALPLYAGILFTSANAVRFFFSRAQETEVPLAALALLPCFAVGPATASVLRQRGLSVQALPERFQAEGLCSLLDAQAPAGKRFLFPRAREAREVLAGYLQERGARVDTVIVYETRTAIENRERLRHLLESGGVDVLTFTSPSTVRAFAELAPADQRASSWRNIPAACIGEVTARSARAHGFSRVLVAPLATAESLAQVILELAPAGRQGDGTGPAGGPAGQRGPSLPTSHS